MVAFVQKNVAGPTGVWTLPSGWVSFEETDPGGAGPSNPKTLIAERIADAADVAASTFTFSHSDPSSPNMNGVILRIASGAGIKGKAVTKLPGPNSPVSSFVCPTHTTLEGPDLIIRAIMFDSTGSNDTLVTTPPAGVTLEAEARNAAPPPFSSDAILHVFSDDALLVVPGATGTATFTVTGLVGDERGVHYTLAIEPKGPLFHGFVKDTTNFSDAKPQSISLDPSAIGTVAGNLLVTVIMQDIQRTGKSIPSGWALVGRPIGFMPMDYESQQPGGQRKQVNEVYYKIAVVSEPVAVWGWSDTFGTGRFGYMMRFSNFDTALLFDDAQGEGGLEAVPSGPTALVYRANAPTRPNSLAVRFGSAEGNTGTILAPTGDLVLDEDKSTEGTSGTHAWIAIAQESPLTGRGLFPRSVPMPSATIDQCVGTLTIAAIKAAGSGLRIARVTRRVRHVQDTVNSTRFVDLSKDIVIPLTDVDDLLLAIGYYNPNISGITIPSGWTNVRTSSPVTTSRGAVTIDRRIAGGAEPDFYTWVHSGSAARRPQFIVFAIKGANNGAPVNIDGINNDLIGAVALSTFDSPDVVTTVDGCLILRWFCSDQGLAFEPGIPSGLTGIIGSESVIRGTKWILHVATDGIQAVQGATGAKTWTGIFTPGTGKAAGTIAIEPAAAVPPGVGGGRPGGLVAFRKLFRGFRIIGEVIGR